MRCFPVLQAKALPLASEPDFDPMADMAGAGLAALGLPPHDTGLGQDSHGGSDGTSLQSKSGQARLRRAAYARGLSANPSESAIVAVFSDGQVGSFPLDNVDILEKDSNPFQPLAGGCHLPSCAVRRIDACARQPLAVTCAEDRCIRIWDFEKRYCAVSKQFSEEVYSCAIHPSGLHVVAGFSDKLRLFNVMIKDLKCFAELPEKVSDSA